MKNTEIKPNLPARRRDGAHTRALLLESAERVFVAKGFDGARVDEIALEAGVNKRMIYIHFVGKDQLYVEVLKTKFQRVVAGTRAGVKPDDSPIEQVKTLISGFFQLLAEDPGLVRLVGWESLSEGRRAGEVLAEFVSVGLEELIVALQAGIDLGVLRADLSVRKLVMSVHALGTFYFSNRALLLSLWGEDISEAGFRKDVLKHILSLVLQGIVAEPHRGTVQI